MRRIFVIALLIFPLRAHAVTIDWVTVGGPGNAADTTGDGAVADVYRIAKYEVTNAQYEEFLNAVAATDTYGLYSTSMDSSYGGITRSGGSGSYEYSAIVDREDMPVNYVSFYDSLRFTNWLHNGQPGFLGYDQIGDPMFDPVPQDENSTEDGAYTFSGPTSVGSRNAGATIFLTSEDEWYKAAYYDPTSESYNPYPFADGFNGAVYQAPPGTTTHSANCDDAVGDLTDVGSYTGSASPNWTFDQGGNVWERNEASIGSWRILRGGNFDDSASVLAASSRSVADPTYEDSDIGFRVATVPEPDAWLLGVTALLVVAGLAAVPRRRSLH